MSAAAQECAESAPAQELAPENHWDLVARQLKKHGIKHIFGLPADDLVSYRALVAGGLEFHLSNDQRQAGYQAIASVAGHCQSVGVLILGKGPAVTHAATAILEAREQRIPLLIITSGVGRQRQGSGAFQELDAATVLAPLTTHQVVARHPAEVGQLVDELIPRATGIDRGPVLLEVPEDFLHADFVPPTEPPLGREPQLTPRDDTPDMSWLSVLQRAKHPGLLIGGGARGVLDTQTVQRFAAEHQLAVLCTASGRGVYDEQDARFLGVSGLYLPAAAHEHVAKIDVLLVLGSRLEETALCGWDLNGVTVIQINLSAADFRQELAGPRVQGCVGQALATVGKSAPQQSNASRSAWDAATQQVHQLSAAETVSWRSPIGRTLQALHAGLSPETISVHENGLHDIWSYNSAAWPIRKDMECLVPSEQTPLGYGVAAAMGLARIQEREVVCISGDGAFTALSAELGQLHELRAPLLYVVLNNQGYGWLQANLQVAEPHADPVFCKQPVAEDAAPEVIAGYARAAGLELRTFDLRAGLPEPEMKAQIQQIAEAVRERPRAAAGQRTAMVLNLLVDLNDVPPGFEELAGDVPAWVADNQRVSAG